MMISLPMSDEVETGADVEPSGAPLSGESDLRRDLVELRPALVRFTRSMTHDPAEAEDLAQEALARAIRYEDRFTPGTDARAWLFTIARRLQQKRWRSASTRPQVVSITDLGDPDERPSEQLVSPLAVEPAVLRRFARSQLLTALQRLPTEQVVPLRLFAGEGMSYRQISDVLEIPLGTVMSRIYRARQQLARLLLEAGE